MLEVVGSCEQRVFGLSPSERVRRQICVDRRLRVKHGKPEMGVAMNACALLDEAALQWLFENPHQLLVTRSGRPLAAAAPLSELARARALVEQGGPGTAAGGRHFIRKLRRTVEMLAVALDEADVRAVERQLYGNVYKGVTDLITKYVWPEPAFHATRLCAALRILPNMVTGTGVFLMFLATWLFFQGEMGWGLAAAWGMTFLDTVDGKLARVTATASKLGNLLDHGTDIVHPPLWWWAVTVGLITGDAAPADVMWVSFAVIIVTYVVSRILEEAFKKRFGFNAFIWERFDSRFRMIISRRNILLLILTAGLLLGMSGESWVIAAGWSLVSVLVQGWRYVSATSQARVAPLRPWLA